MTNIKPFVDMVHAEAKALGIEQRFDDGISWMYEGLHDELKFLFSHPTAGPVMTCFDGQLAIMFCRGDEAIREVVIAELDGIPKAIAHEREVLGKFKVKRSVMDAKRQLLPDTEPVDAAKTDREAFKS